MNELPELPSNWHWKSSVTQNSVTVELYVGQDRGDFQLASRSIPCIDPDQWEEAILGIAGAIWEDYNLAAKLSAKLGIDVIYT